MTSPAAAPSWWTGAVPTVIGSVAIAAVLSLAYNAASGRLLGPESYSDVAGGLALATLLAVALGALTPITAVVSARYIAAGRPARIRGLAVQLVRLALAGGAVVLLIALIAGGPIARALQFRSTALVIAAVLVYVGIAASSVIRAAIRGAQQFGVYSRNVIAEAAIRLGAGVALLLMTRSAVLAILAYALGTLVATVAGLRALRRLSDDVEPVDLTEVTSMLGATAALSAAMAVFQNVDVLLVKHLFEPAQAGIYGAAAALARTMAVTLMPLEALLLPRLTYLLERRERVIAPIARLASGFILIGAVPLLLFALVPDMVIAAIYGRAYDPAAVLLLPLAAAMFLLYLSYLTGQVLISLGRPRLTFAFAALVAIEVVAVMMVHDSLLTVAVILVTTRSVALIVMALGLPRWRHP